MKILTGRKFDTYNPAAPGQQSYSPDPPPSPAGRLDPVPPSGGSGVPPLEPKNQKTR